jgi:hypothetical protein
MEICIFFVDITRFKPDHIGNFENTAIYYMVLKYFLVFFSNYTMCWHLNAPLIYVIYIPTYPYSNHSYSNNTTFKIFTKKLHSFRSMFVLIYYWRLHCFQLPYNSVIKIWWHTIYNLYLDEMILSLNTDRHELNFFSNICFAYFNFIASSKWKELLHNL